MRYFAHLLPGLLLASAACVPLGTPITDPNATGTSQSTPVAAAPTLRYEDATYSPDVRSVQCYVATGQATQVFTPPVVSLAQDLPVTLEFDVLSEQGQRLTARLVHCDADWKPSILTDMQFLSQINEQTITDYRTSVNTKVPYYHYRTQLPRVKISGNYLWVVQTTAGVPVLSRRVLVYDNRVEAFLQPGPIAAGQQRYTMQQLNFGIRYGGYPIVNPAQEVKVVLRQNFRWDNARYNLRPTFVRDAERQLDYQYFNFENAFPGLSEYRFLDLRSFRASGAGVARINPEASPREADLLPEATRNGLAYSQYPDVDGQRVLESREYGTGATNADYLNVTFHLRAPQPAPGPVYVLGALSDWQLREENKLTYNAEAQEYQGRLLLKQGYYNYSYAVGGAAVPNEVYFEGSHQETENQYDLLVYYRPPGTRTDLLIGYSAVAVANAQIIQLNQGR
ncbi:DUF5103 domain-containing protein [Hymenobacter lutimineralis]|uniref:DUF5103 domain-containing protein n=1 Tax=Hymenobacter lutimineralis TaxID=2606448 RepID=A0A5D6UVY9_9BACT|nr:MULTISPECIES: DUF5103 domain-containing protein [Hymenobacter]QIX60473.1 DUF5103 domain-containing protein [Hymenobacter sp. BT18]TYZ06554.1 DUF5103 domain-containing protein [Hymenobacter lutimineralis]